MMKNNNPTKGGRILCQFSCGAASAIATKLAIKTFQDTHEIVIVNAEITEEHDDNRRFFAQCAEWFGREITIVFNEMYNASTREVFKRRRFFASSRYGAPCSRLLKREPLDEIRLQNDEIVLGYTMEENHRLERFLDANADLIVHAPLIENGLSKADCMALLKAENIELPMMYRLGFNNANCIGCVKGGEGYWNLIRKVFPERFDEMAEIQAIIGESANIFRDRKTGKRYSLKELDPKAGRHKTILPDCSFFCEMAKLEMESELD